ncbi:MAG: hypothetical protein IKK21_11565, partial [Clostridia bacterium]|nr:hypothetical protein [Clostridia bacterium]
SNMFVIGDALVSVRGDEVTVDYVLRPHDKDAINVTSECVKWFDTLEEITDEFCQDPSSDLAFGQTISKAELGDVGYLFICNRVTYRQPVLRHVGVSLPGYYTKQPKWQAYFAELEAVMALEAPAETAEEAPAEEPAPSPEASEIPADEVPADEVPADEVPAAE